MSARTRGLGAVAMLIWLTAAAWLVAGMLRVLWVEEERVLPRLPAGVGAGPALERQDTAPDNRVIVLRNLFGSAIGSTPPPGQVGGSPAAECRLPVELVGTVVASAVDWSLALIAERGRRREAGWFRVGDEILPGASLWAVFADRVWIARAGQLEELPLGAEAEADRPPVPAAGRGAGPVLAHPDGPDRYRVDGAALQQLLLRPEQAARDVRLVPVGGGQGGWGGVRLTMRPGSILEQIGLMNGDRIERLNGFAIGDPGRMLELYERLKQARSIDIELRRAGRPLRLQLRIE